MPLLQYIILINDPWFTRSAVFRQYQPTFAFVWAGKNRCQNRAALRNISRMFMKTVLELHLLELKHCSNLSYRSLGKWVISKCQCFRFGVNVDMKIATQTAIWQKEKEICCYLEMVAGYVCWICLLPRHNASLKSKLQNGITSGPSPPTMGSILFIIQLYELVASFGAAALFALVACNRGPSLCSLCLPASKLSENVYVSISTPNRPSWFLQMGALC